MRIYCINSRGQRRRGGSPAWGVRLGVTTPRLKNFSRYGTFLKASDLVWGSCECCNEHSASIK